MAHAVRSWRIALRRGRVVVRPRILGRPSRSPRPDSHRGFLVQGQVGLLLPHGAMVAPPRFERGPPRPGRGALPVAPRGCDRRIRENTGRGAPRDGVAHRPDTKTQRHPGTRVSVWRRHYLRVMPLAAVGTRYVPMGSTMPCASCNRSPRTQGYLGVSPRRARTGTKTGARGIEPRPCRPRRRMLSGYTTRPTPSSRIERLPLGSRPSILSGRRRGREVGRRAVAQD